MITHKILMDFIRILIYGLFGMIIFYLVFVVLDFGNIGGVKGAAINGAVAGGLFGALKQILDIYIFKMDKTTKK